MTLRHSLISTFALGLLGLGMSLDEHRTPYRDLYDRQLSALDSALRHTVSEIRSENVDATRIEAALHGAREHMKVFDAWARYLEPISQKRINGPLPVEWETEVFEKYEKPYRRDGAGLTLAELYAEEPSALADSTARLIEAAVSALAIYREKICLQPLEGPDHFFFLNRLHLLNLGTIHTTGFDCPDKRRIVPELRIMMRSMLGTYEAFNATFPKTPVTPGFVERYVAALRFVEHASDDPDAFDHFTFLRDHIGPLFRWNQEMIERYGVRSRSYMDYSLNKSAQRLFSKDLYIGQNARGVFQRVTDQAAIEEIAHLGQQLFFDPVLSGNNQRSCASCHRADMCFTDTTNATAEAFDHKGRLARNAPTLVNADLNHLLMQDGKHFLLQAQAHAVMTTPEELGANAETVLVRILACANYRTGFERALAHTPQLPKVTMQHVVSALTTYYTGFSKHLAPFDAAMNNEGSVSPAAERGFNLFMGKAQCGTCHFPPQFNGVKPPYIGSEFEVIGTPADAACTTLSPDVGRYAINPAVETRNAFRTGGLRNIARTGPYMHNGVFRTLREVIDHYDAGGGAGRGLDVPNQTLSADSLHLTTVEKEELEAFLLTLNEELPRIKPPTKLPTSRDKSFNARRVGGEY